MRPSIERTGSEEVIRASGHYPLLSGGDINLYSLFVERAMTLVKPDGLVGLLTPIGIATDITSAPFFAERIRACSVKAFLAFENRRGWLFPDIHHEEQPSIFVFAPSQHQFSDFEFCVRISSWEQFKNSNRRFRVSANLLREVNPNTETAPIFRTRRDAELTTAIYRRLPVLVDRSSERGSEGMASEILDDVPHDQRLPPVPHAGGAGRPGKRVSHRR